MDAKNLVFGFQYLSTTYNNVVEITIKHRKKCRKKYLLITGILKNNNTIFYNGPAVIEV